jgi:hypothetical protein
MAAEAVAGEGGCVKRPMGRQTTGIFLTGDQSGGRLWGKNSSVPTNSHPVKGSVPNLQFAKDDSEKNSTRLPTTCADGSVGVFVVKACTLMHMCAHDIQPNTLSTKKTKTLQKTLKPFLKKN